MNTVIVNAKRCSHIRTYRAEGKACKIYLWGNSGDCNWVLDNKHQTIIKSLEQRNWVALEGLLERLSCIVLIESDVYAYCSRMTAFPIFFGTSNDLVYLSDDIESIATALNIDPDPQRIASLCWGANCIPYKSIKPLCLNKHYVYADNRLDVVDRCTRKKFYEIGDFRELVAISRELVINAVDECLKNVNGKIALTLSGGLDSSVLAVCLKLLGKQFECINWFSEQYKPVDERMFVYDLRKKYDITIHYIDISKRIVGNDGYVDEEFEYHLPYNHDSFSWWNDTVKLALDANCNAIVTGFKGDSLFSHEFNRLHMRNVLGRNFRWKLEYFLNTFSVPFYKSYKFEKNNVSYVSVNEYEWIRSIEFINPIYAKNIDSDQETEIFFQKESMNHNIIFKENIDSIYPYLNDKLLDFSEQIPFYYKVLPVGGVILQKPILRVAFEKELPDKIRFRTSKSNFGMLSDKFCAINKQFVCDLLGNKSVLKEMGIIDPDVVKEIYQSNLRVCSNAYSLINACFIELWLRRKMKRNV